MRYIDSFNHFFPQAFFDRLLASDGAARDIGKRMRGVKALYDLDTRLRIVDSFPDYSQVLSLGMPPLDILAGPEEAAELARIGNDGLADLVARHPGQFCGFVAALPMNNPEAAVREAERAFRDLGANGVQLHTNVNGAPLDEERFFPIFETIANADRAILLHPVRSPKFADYVTEDKSKYEIWTILGWPYETSVAMARMVFSGMMDRLPNMKVVAHHLGAMIPFFGTRIEDGWDQLGTRTSDEDYGALLKRLKKRPADYFQQDFYGDTALAGGAIGMRAGIDYYGAGHVLFASDCPFDREGGYGFIRHTIAGLDSLDLPRADREKICWRNAVRLLHLPE